MHRRNMWMKAAFSALCIRYRQRSACSRQHKHWFLVSQCEFHIVSKKLISTITCTEREESTLIWALIGIRLPHLNTTDATFLWRGVKITEGIMIRYAQDFGPCNTQQGNNVRFTQMIAKLNEQRDWIIYSELRAMLAPRLAIWLWTFENIKLKQSGRRFLALSLCWPMLLNLCSLLVLYLLSACCCLCLK